MNFRVISQTFLKYSKNTYILWFETKMLVMGWDQINIEILMNNNNVFDVFGKKW